MQNRTIVFLEDDEALRNYYSVVLEARGFTVVQDGNSKHLAGLLDIHRPCLLISDLVMPEHEGIEGILSILGKYKVPIIAISSYPQYLQIAKSMVQLTIQKPVSAEELLAAVETVLAREGKVA